MNSAGASPKAGMGRPPYVRLDAPAARHCCTQVKEKAKGESLVNVERVTIGLILVFLRALHGLFELLFEESFAVFERA